MKQTILLKARWLLCGLLAVFLTTNLWADEELVYTLAPASGSNNSYASACDVVISGITWNVTGNAQQIPWRIGGKSLSNVDRTVYSKTAMGSAITKVELSVGTASSITVNSLKLVVASDENFSTKIDEVNATFEASSTIIFSPTSPTTEWATGAYYKFVFNVSVTGSSNKYVQFTEAKFYAAGSGSGETVVKTLKSIAVEGMTTSYEVGDAFSFDGTCTATYSVTVNDVAQADDVKTVIPTSVSTPDMTVAGDKTITVTYTEDEVETSTTYNINVAAVEGDKLTRETTGVSGTNYTDWSEKTGASGAEYAGNSAGGNDAIQLRSDKNTSGIVSTATGGLIKKVKVAWNSNTTSERTLNVYGSNTAYTAASELYGSGTQGTLLGTIVKGTSTELEITGDYEYVGVRSNSGAMYLTSITFVWGAGKQLESIAVKTNPDKVSYNIGDAFDATGLVITASYDNSTSEDIAYSGNESEFSFSGFNSTAAAAAQAITVTYGGKSTTFNVEIKDVTLQTVTVSGTPTTTSYTAGNAFDPAGLTVMGHYSDNSDAAITSGITWSYPDVNNTLIADQTSIRVVATVEEIASAAYTVEGLTVTAAPQNVTWDLSTDSYDADPTDELISWSSAYVTMSNSKGTSSTAVNNYIPTTRTSTRMYTNNVLTITPAEGYQIESVVFTATSTSYAEALKNSTWNNAEAAVSSSTVTVTPTAKSSAVSATIGATTGLTSVVVTYSTAAPAAKTPTFSVAEGTYFETQNVTITTATAGATIYYTTDGTTPTTGSSVYSEAIAVSTDMTIKAIAVKDGLENSAVASATYAMGPIFNSLEDLVAADLTSNTMVKVSFSNVAIKTIDTNKKYVTFDIQKEDKDIEIYFSAETLPTTWVGGGTLSGTILAPWVRYEKSNVLQCWELKPEAGWHWTDLTYNSPITKTIDYVTVTGTATKTEYVDGEVFDPAGLTVTLYYTDETNEVVTEGILWAPTTALTEGTTSVNVTATVNDVTSAALPVDVTVTAIPTKTIAEFIAAGGGRCYLVGAVSNLTNNNKNCTLTDNSGEILLYNISQNGAVTDFVTLDVEEGDRIKVIATTYQVYSQKDEVVAPEFVEELAPEVVAVTGVTVAPTEATVKVGKTVTLTATVLPALATNTNVSWESDATDIATVENGDVTGVAEGVAHITVTTEDGLFTAKATITVEAGQSFAGGEWRLVTDAAQLSINDYLIIASSEYNKAMSSTQNDNNRGEADVTIAGGILTYESAPAIFTLKAGNEEGRYAFYDEDAEGYLFAASSSKNYLRTQAMVDANASWEITITDGVASVVAQGTNTHNLMQYNNSSKIFSCYETAQKAVGLYKYYDTPATRYAVTFAANGGEGDAPVVADQLEGATFNLPANTFTYEGYQFAGWNDGTNTYGAGAKYTMPDAAVTFNAQWTKDTREAVVFVCAYDGSYYAIGQTLSNKALNAIKIDVFNGKMLNVNATTRAQITWYKSAVDGGYTFQTADDLYLTAISGETYISLSTEACTWTYDAENDYYKQGTRTLLVQNGTTVKNYAATNANTGGYSDYAHLMTEYVDGTVETLREGLEAGKLGTLCWNKKLVEVEGAVLYDPEYPAVGQGGVGFIETTSMEAGKPFVFQASGEKIRALVTDEATLTPGTNNGLVGSLSGTTVPDGDYIVYQNRIHRAYSSTISANRAYLHMESVDDLRNTIGAAPSRRRLVIGQPSQTPTGNEQVNAELKAEKVMIDGHIYILRGEKMYDLNGQQVR